MALLSGDIIIKGARQHNLRNITLRLPRGKITVFTGVSGSGKSSLVFDTLYAEGHRQYIETLSSRARQWLDQMDRPDVDYIQGLSPVIAVEQRSARGTSQRSTLATATEIADYARLFWSLEGEQFCPKDGGRILRRSFDECLARVNALPEGTRLMILAPFARTRPALLREELRHLQLRGYQRARVGGVIGDLDDPALCSAKGAEIDIEIVIDRLVRAQTQTSRLADSLELAFREGSGRAIVLIPDGEPQEMRLAMDFSCETCGETYEPLSPRHFSHNHPDGACPVCGGLGKTLQFQPELVVPDPSLSLKDGALKPWNLGTKRMISARKSILRQLSAQVPFPLDVPWRDLPPEKQKLILHGDPLREFTLRPFGAKKTTNGHFRGVIADLDETARNTTGETLRSRLLAFQTAKVCPACGGRRVNARALAVRIGGISLADFLALPASYALDFVHRTTPLFPSAEDARRGLKERLGFLVKTGLGYLTLDRAFVTLSGGEARRARLATQLGLALVGVTYVLDEPSIGLHPADHRRLLDTLIELRDRGNTLLIVEHDEDTIRAADQIVEIGPGAGSHGGNLVFQGTPTEAENDTAPPDSPHHSRTGDYLAGRAHIEKNAKTLPTTTTRKITVANATENNLRTITAHFPIGVFTVVCGVSGSGKSTLVNDILAETAARKINGAKTIPGKNGGISGLEHFTGFVRVEQNPIGKSGRSTPATFTGVFDELRNLFASTPLSRVRGYTATRFSFNVRGGRCERCGGEGRVPIDMQFLGETLVTCPSCHGARYNRETLEVRYHGLNIAEILALTVNEASDLFKHHVKLRTKLDTLAKIGLGYLQLGQPADTLSGGELQRIKLSLELARRQRGETLYILDEPTTGLHWDDIQRLLDILLRLRDAGNTIIVVEHHRDIIRHADWLIELGEGGGDAGGNLIFEGTPNTLAQHAKTPTARHL
ncbi:MAG: excinuclease ABC subunit UvrA [Puniceicoccales bacterium]|jgi:excinuclease ABC subunit A|nr:excinuclease ABC subunit UvrA [Puniceicoccales bacterium]